jgi:hypothetical protein
MISFPFFLSYLFLLLILKYNQLMLHVSFEESSCLSHICLCLYLVCFIMDSLSCASFWFQYNGSGSHNHHNFRGRGRGRGSAVCWYNPLPFFLLLIWSYLMTRNANLTLVSWSTSLPFALHYLFECNYSMLFLEEILSVDPMQLYFVFVNSKAWNLTNMTTIIIFWFDNYNLLLTT